MSGQKNHTWVSANSSVSPQVRTVRMSLVDLLQFHIQYLFNKATYSASDLIQSFYIRTINVDLMGTYGFNPPLDKYKHTVCSFEIGFFC